MDFTTKFQKLQAKKGILEAKRIMKSRAEKLFIELIIEYLHEKEYISDNTREYLVRGLI